MENDDHPRGRLLTRREALALSRGVSPAALGIIGDAEIELGRYPAGFATFARMAAPPMTFRDCELKT